MGNAQEHQGRSGKGRQSKQGENRRKRKKSKGAEQLLRPAVQKQEAKPVKEEPLIIIPKVAEPTPSCALCGKPIESIAQSIGGPQPETFSHFDCVLRKIADDEHLLPTQKVSYIGRGTFAIIEVHEDKTFTIIKRIIYESPETFSFMKKYVEGRKR